jgi:hypothetical protein
MWNTLEASESVLHLFTWPVHFLFEILGRHPYIIYVPKDTSFLEWEYLFRSSTDIHFQVQSYAIVDF